MGSVALTSASINSMHGISENMASSFLSLSLSKASEGNVFKVTRNYMVGVSIWFILLLLCVMHRTTYEHNKINHVEAGYVEWVDDVFIVGCI